jgi:hypothetical protein
MVVTVTGAETIGSAQLDGSIDYWAYDLTSTGDLTIQGTVTINANGAVYLSGIETEGPSGTPVLEIAAGGAFEMPGSAMSAYGFYSQAAPATFINDGTFFVQASSGSDGVTLVAGGTFDNAGSLTVQSANGSALGLEALGVTTGYNTGQVTVSAVDTARGLVLKSGGFTNGGSITVTSTGGAVEGVEVDGSTLPGNSPSFVNTGDIHVSGPHGEGVQVGSGFALNNSGLIVAQGGAAGVTVGGDGSDTSTIVNSNQITASGGSSPSIGISVDSIFTPGFVDIVNGGTITADHTIEMGGNGVLNLHNTGVLNGDVVDYSSGGGAQILNSGHIIGDVDLMEQVNNLYDGRGGTLTGRLNLGSGVNVAYLGDDGETVSFALGSPADNTTIYGGKGADTLYAWEGALTFYVGGGNDVLDGLDPIIAATTSIVSTNTVSFAEATSGVTVDLGVTGPQNTGFGQVTITRFQNLSGSAFNDHLIGDANNNVIDGGGGNDILTGGGGADTFVYRAGYGNDTITDFSTLVGDVIDVSSVANLYQWSDVLADMAQVGADTVITIGSGSLRLQGVLETNLTAANFRLAPPPPPPPPTLTGASANNFTDTLQGVRQQYTVGAGGTAVEGGPENADNLLVNMQRLQFADGYETYSTTDKAAEVYRLYEATLNRGSDPEGLAFWVNQMNTGTSLQSVANGFVNSAEFQQQYGQLSNASFIHLLYENVLHRGADPTGLSFWLGQMSSGQTQAQVVLGFSESTENINDSATALSQGLWVGSTNAAEVARLYDTTLGREPDLTGLTFWTNQLNTGASQQSVVNGFTSSTEFQNTYGALNNNDFVSLLYHNTLHRAPDQTGLIFWVGQLTSGAETRAQVVLGFSDSNEHIADTAPHIDGGIWVA